MSENDGLSIAKRFRIKVRRFTAAAVGSVTVGSATAGFVLRSLRDVEAAQSWFIATSPDPWLSLESALPAALAGRLVEIVYRASFWDAPARPVFRFRLSDGTEIVRIGAGPVAGAGIWIGRIPKATSRMEVSPTNQRGPFGFRIEAMRPVSWLSLLRRGFRNRPKSARSALLTRVIGWRPESDVNLTWATASTPMGAYPSWHRARVRPFERDGIDRPRCDWMKMLPVRVFIGRDEEGTRDGALLGRTLDSLLGQVFPNWTATLLATPSAGFPDDPRISTVGPQSESAGTLTCRIDVGDVLTPMALAHVVEQAHRHPSCRLFYGDSLCTPADGSPTPSFQPGWSHLLFAARPPRDALVIVRDLAGWPPEERRRFLDRDEVAPSVFARLSALEARPLRRILVERRRSSPRPIAPPVCHPIGPGGNASIIIPSRDQPALLGRLVASIRAQGYVRAPQIVIVDNGSVTGEAKGLLAELARSANNLCLYRPGAFNFSALCNQAARVAAGDVLVFLNDDTEVLSPDWLDRLTAHAMAPAIGAVGARLTYPDGRLQHMGVLVGMGESAGHFGISEFGWAGRGEVPHEVSAVTGACLAVAREKFEAVGGFDDTHLPVELSDVDLCLKLNARGWQTIVDPAVHLMHEESASRGGATFRRLDVYANQRAIFVERWRHVLRDDPVFHPGLSLYSCEAALG